MFNNLLKSNVAGLQLQDLISQVTPEQAAQLRTFIIDNLLQEKTFNSNNPFFVVLKENTNGQYDLLKNELIEKIQTLPISHPAKSLVL